MKRNSVISFATIAVLLICNIILMFASNKLKLECDRSTAALYPYVQKYAFLKDNIEANIQYSTQCIEDTDVTDNQKRVQKLSELFNAEDDMLFILRISDRYCNSCVEYFVDLFVHNDFHSKQRFCYLTGFQNDARVEFDTKKLGISTNDVYNVPFLNVPIDYAGFPYLMVLNKKLEVEYCYFPTKGYNAIDIENLDMIINFYAKKYETM